MKTLVTLQITIFLLVAVGFVLKRIHIVGPQGQKNINDMVIYVILPCNILRAFLDSPAEGSFLSYLEVLLISVFIQIFCVIYGKVVFRKETEGRQKCLRYGTICSNAGFLGKPVAEGLYGSIGLLYASVYLIPQRIVMWSAGISYFTESPSRKEVVKKVLTHPCIVAVEIGIVLMVTQVKLPGFLSSAIDNVGGCTTAITMILIGTILTDADMRHILTKTTALYSFIRLIFIPAVVFAGCWLAGIDSIVAGVSVTLAAMPAGTTTAILAMKYHGDEEFATQCVVLTTLLSVVAIPAWSLIIHSAL